jgi:membrane protein
LPRARPIAGRFARVAEGALRAFFAHNCPKLAAAISFHVLFALFPIAILFVAIAGFFLDDVETRTDLLAALLDRLPLSEDGQRDLEELLDDVASPRSALGFLAVPILLWTAGGMMSAIRVGLDQAWRVSDRRPALQGKLVDLVLIAFLGILAVASLGITVLLRVTGEVTDSVGHVVGQGSADALVVALGILLSIALAFLTAALLYHYVPAVRPTVRDVWPAALFAAVSLEAAKWLFAVYLESFASYNAVYGSLGVIIAFLAFVYLVANLLLLGAEAAAHWPGSAETPEDDGMPLGPKVLRELRGLAFRPRPKGRDPDG